MYEASMKSTMIILSYNVNGLRAAIAKGFLEWLASEAPDILCIQETKMQDEQLEPRLFEPYGYTFFHHPAEKKGYSGVALLVRDKPDQLIIGMGNETYDREGRVIRADYGDISLINVYIPSGTTGGSRQDFKMEFLSDFHDYIRELMATREKLIVTGDFNICHRAIDINHPERHKKSSGFLPEERRWVDKFLSSGFLDSFREFNSEPGQYSWWSYRAMSRQKNLGWRIDYHMVSLPLRPQLKGSGILKDVNHSDHCPVMVEIDLN